VARQKYSETGDPPVPAESYIDLLDVEKLSLYTLEKTRAADAFATITGVCWSPNQNQIAFARFDSIWLVSLDNEQAPVRLGDGEACAWSKDGKMLAVIEAIFSEDKSVKASKIYILDISTGERQDIYSQSTRLRDSIAWAPGSKRLAFVENHLPNATVNTSTATVNILDLDSGTRKMPISFDEIFSPTWSPDGTMLAITIISYHSTASLYDPKLMVIKADDGSILWESSVRDALYPIAWSPDSKTIAFVHRWAVYALDVNALLKKK
jgi:Tol biopolymer transport system component